MTDTCRTCIEFREWNDSDMKVIRSGESAMNHMEKEVIPRSKAWVEHCRIAHQHKPKKRYAFTFTTNQDTKLEIQKEMCESAYKLFTQKTIPIAKGEVYLEYTEAHRPHLHGWYETEDGGRVFAKIFRRVWSPWGEKDRMKRFPGGYHEEMKGDRYIGYASSEGRLILSKEENEEVKYNEETAEIWDE